MKTHEVVSSIVCVFFLPPKAYDMYADLWIPKTAWVGMVTGLGVWSGAVGMDGEG
jgi:hypothetical protein